MKIRLLVLSVLLGSLCSDAYEQNNAASALAGIILVKSHLDTAPAAENCSSSTPSAGSVPDLVVWSANKPFAMQLAENQITCIDNAARLCKVVLAKTVYHNLAYPRAVFLSIQTSTGIYAEIKAPVNGVTNKSFFEWYDVHNGVAGLVTKPDYNRRVV